MAVTPDNSKSFSDRLLSWFAIHGRKNLPWQSQQNAYRVWVSEIMLQQTQVNTVIPYFEKFMQRFPTVAELAEAPEDTVLHYWTGLGYYARARNLHRTAKRVQQELHGKFPTVIEELIQLPGIGRSTAGAIVSLAYKRRAPILDGNVKRVLCRYHGIEGWPGLPKVQTELWLLAEKHLPRQDCADYTQALMDLGATVCTRSKPACPACPLREDCLAFSKNLTHELPAAKPHRTLPEKSTTMLILRSARDNRVLLKKRPAQGVWGGLWSFPEIDASAELERFLMQHELGPIGATEPWQPLHHTFSHFRLEIRPLLVHLENPYERIMENSLWHWYDLLEPPELGLASPVRKLLTNLTHSARHG